MQGCRSALLLVRISQKRLAAIFNAAHRFRASNLRLLKTNCHETQLRDRPLPSPTFYHCVGWHFYSDPDAISQGCSPSLGGRRAWVWREISGRVDLGWCWRCLHRTPWSIACHEQQRTMREVLAVGDAPGGHRAAAPSPAPAPHCLQSFPYPQKHERGAVTDTKPCTKHRRGAPV